MKLSEILQSRHTINNVQADSKKAALEFISKLIAKDLLDTEYEQVFDCLIAREKIGNTGIGHGVAIPHGRIENISQPMGILVHLQKPIDFNAIDNDPVDLFFAVLIPEQSAEQHLKILAALAEKFRHKEFREKLRQAKDDKELYQLATK